MDSCNDLQVVNNTISDQEDQTPRLCANGCGFFGTKEFKNLCSKCFKDSLLRNQNVEKDEIHNNNPFPCFNNNHNKDVVVTKNEVVPDDDNALCSCCKKRIRSMMIYNCRCGGRFCTKHRCPEEHSCNFDYKNLGRVVLARQNPLVKADKLDQRI